MKEPKCPSTEEWKRNGTYIQLNIMQPLNGINLVVCRDVNGPRDCHTEWNKSERGKTNIIFNAYMWNLEKCYR